ncbi:MAG: anti-sigma factor antagonist, partial [Proteobacteria bacterium]|nr:anti-sigma factor antagonist [Pseudomonadota bacterium]
MDPGRLTVDVRDAGIGACVLAFRGCLDTRGETCLSDAHALTQNRGARVLVAEVSGLESLDGAGLALLVKLWAWAARE